MKRSASEPGLRNSYIDFIVTSALQAEKNSEFQTHVFLSSQCTYGFLFCNFSQAMQRNTSVRGERWVLRMGFN